MCTACAFSLRAASAAADPASDLSAPDRRRWLCWGAATLAGAYLPVAQAQVEVGQASRMRHLVPAQELEQAAEQQYADILAKAKAQGTLLPASNPQVQGLQRIAQRLIPFTYAWNPRAREWHWQVALIRSNDVNAFCMPGGKIAFFTGSVVCNDFSDTLVDKLRHRSTLNVHTFYGVDIGLVGTLAYALGT